MSSKKIRLAIVGAGNIANKVLPSIKKVSDIEVIAVASQRKEAAHEFAKKHQLEKSYSYEDCFADSSLDAVYITNLTSDHAQTIKQALNAGLHVICEKPLVLTLADAKELFEIAESKKLILLEGFMYRFHPQIIKLKEIIAADEIGIIKSIQVNFSFILHDLAKRPRRMSSKSGGGALFDIGCYGVDFINSIVGANQFPVEIKTIRRTDPHDPAFDLSTNALLKYENGIIAELNVSLDAPGLNLWEVSGSHGSVSALRFDTQGTNPVPIYLVNAESEAKLISCKTIDQFEEQFKSFAESITQQAPTALLPAESIQNARLLEQICKSVYESH